MVEVGILSEDEHFELIEGELVPRFPRGNDHEIVRAALGESFACRTPDDLRVAVVTSLYLDDRTFVEPDLCLYAKRLMPEDVKGSDVLLAIEVAGSSISYDRGLKARICARHGVRELWVIDAATRDTWVHRRPVTDGNWGSVEKIEPDKPLSPAALPDIAIRMAGLD